jgi:hypothetical protein
MAEFKPLAQMERAENVINNTTAEEEAALGEKWARDQEEAKLFIKFMGFLLSIVIAPLLLGFSHKSGRGADTQAMLRDLSIFFWITLVIFTWLLRKNIAAFVRETCTVISSLATFARIWSHIIINTVCLTLWVALIIMTICMVDKPKLQDNPIFLAFYAMTGLGALVSFCKGGYNLVFLICK